MSHIFEKIPKIEAALVKIHALFYDSSYVHHMVYVRFSVTLFIKYLFSQYGILTHTSSPSNWVVDFPEELGWKKHSMNDRVLMFVTLTGDRQTYTSGLSNVFFLCGPQMASRATNGVAGHFTY